jgi:hypothetical protein
MLDQASERGDYMFYIQSSIETVDMNESGCRYVPQNEARLAAISGWAGVVNESHCRYCER